MGFFWEMTSPRTCPSPGSLARSQDVNFAQVLLTGCDHMAACCSEKLGVCSLEKRKAGGQGGRQKGKTERERETD